MSAQRIRVSHLDAVVRDELVRAEDARHRQQHPAPQTPPEPTRRGDPGSGGHQQPVVRKPPPVKKKPPVKRQRAKAEPVLPALPPGSLVLSPREVEVVSRLLDTHPDLQQPSGTDTTTTRGATQRW